MIENRLREWAAGRGYGLAIAGTGVVDTVRAKLEARRAGGQIDAEFFDANLRGFRYLEGALVRRPARVVLVAVPSPIQVLPLVKDGKRIEGLLPPTYVRYNRMFTDVLADMRSSALGDGAQAEVLRAPLKSLAVHMGLVVYGRNNITYAPGLGSGHQLCGYIVGLKDAPAGPGPVVADAPSGDRGERMLERCIDCRICVKACPAGAIREDRFLIAAEKCFTYFSESSKPIPSWAKAPRTLSLIGCMACQEVCPENRGRLKTEPCGIEFSEEETEALLAAGRSLGPDGGKTASGDRSVEPAALASARGKFDTLGLTEDFEVFGRNLAFFLKRGT